MAITSRTRQSKGASRLQVKGYGHFVVCVYVCVGSVVMGELFDKALAGGWWDVLDGIWFSGKCGRQKSTWERGGNEVEMR